MKIFAIISLLFFCTIFTSHAQTLKEAIKAKDTILAAKLIKEGANPDEKDTYGATLLMGACHFPDLPVAGFLLRHGATTEVKTAKGRTALGVACAYWCGVDMVKLLVENGADVNTQSLDGMTPLMLAASFEKLDVVIYLLEHGADATKKNTSGKSALDLASEGKVEDYMKTSIKDTRFDKEKVIEVLTTAMKKNQ